MSKQKTPINIGGVSLLMIFVLLCLTTFATLSLVSANADYRLSQRAADAVENYYRADSEAERRLAEVVECMGRARIITSGSLDYFSRCADFLRESNEYQITYDEYEMTIGYQIPVDDTRELSVELRLDAFKAGGMEYELTAWQVVVTEPWVEDESGFDLWSGDLALFG